MSESAQTIRVDHASAASAEQLARPLAALARGAWVGCPTETLYVLATRGDRLDAREQLAAFEARGAEQRLTWLAHSNEQLRALGATSAVIQRLIERYWPGPLTLLLPGRADTAPAAEHEGWTAVRRPAHPLAAALLQRADHSVVAADASRRGEPAASEALALVERFGAQLECVLDAGPARMAEPSALLAVGPGRFELVREGLIDLAALRATAGLRIGMVCTGNTCRSPMAEALARAALAQRLGAPVGRLHDFGFSVTSMGVYAASGAPASSHSVSVLAERGIDLSEHRSQPAAPELVARLDRVYALTRSHLEALAQALPPGKSKHCMLLDPQGRDIADPIGGPRSEYAAVAAQIEAAIAQRLDEWA